MRRTSYNPVTHLVGVPAIALSTHIIRAKLMHDKRTYRDIEIRSDKTLYHLAEAILDAFDFDMDHAFGFYSDLGWDYYDSPVRYELFTDMGMSDDWGDFGGRPKAKGVKRTRLSVVFTELKQKMQFLFDYGDDWRFEIEFRSFGERTKGAAYPRILAAKGPSPEQYPDWEDDEEE